MFHILCSYLFSMASNTIDSFDPFNIFELIDFLLTPCFFHHLRAPRRLAWLLPWREMQRFESIVGGHVEDHNSRLHAGRGVNHGCDEPPCQRRSTFQPLCNSACYFSKRSCNERTKS